MLFDFFTSTCCCEILSNGLDVSTKINCGCLLITSLGLVFELVIGINKVIGQQLTAESELARTPGIRLSN